MRGAGPSCAACRWQKACVPGRPESAAAPFKDGRRSGRHKRKAQGPQLPRKRGSFLCSLDGTRAPRLYAALHKDRALKPATESCSKLTRQVSPRGWLIGEAAYRLTAPGAAECRGPRIGLSLLDLPPHSRRTMRNPHTLAKGRPQT
jgi:hypothetical protein